MKVPFTRDRSTCRNDNPYPLIRTPVCRHSAAAPKIWKSPRVPLARDHPVVSKIRMKTRQQLLTEIAALAVQVERETKLPAELTVAQWAVESMWGTHPTGKANYFGMKAAKRHTQTCKVPTHEHFTDSQIAYWNRTHPATPCTNRTPIHDTQGTLFSVEIEDTFADYPDMTASVHDYAFLITNTFPYAVAFARFLHDHDFAALAHGVLTVYATADYATLVLKIAAQNNVRQAIQDSRIANNPPAKAA